MATLDISKPLHCVEMTTGKNLTGILRLNNDEIRVDIYSYEDFFHIDSALPVYLLAETGKIFSFHANIDSGIGTRNSHEQTIYHQGIIANVSIIGHRRWTENDKVKQVTFSVEHSMALLRHQKKVKALGSSRLPRDDHFEIFEVSAKGLTLKASYGASYGMEFDTPKKIWPIFSIEFDEPAGIHEYMHFVIYYVSFLSFCFGVKLNPSEIHIDRMSYAEMIESIEARTYLGDYEVHYVWPNAAIDSHDLWVGGSPVRAWDERELGAMRASLVAWVDRAHAWRNSYSMMMVSFALKRVISAERLINACRWFEEIPIASAMNALSKEDIDAISAAATDAAKECGHPPAVRERISSAIRRIKEETADERFTRLLSMVKNKFGDNIVSNDAIVDLKKAIQFRGRAAHGHFTPESEDEFLAFNKSTRAIEALCYLLTSLDLPLSSDGIKRVRNNPLVRDYRHAHD